MTDFGYFRQQAQMAELGKFHFLFLADNVYITEKTAPYSMSRFEPLTLMSALASVTRHIGLAATLSSTYTEPFNAARLFASLDHLSGGRAAWNVVTSFTDDSASNFSGAKLPPHDERYRIAEEHLATVKGLWDTWEDGTLVHDKATGQFIDADKLHRLDHHGEYYSVRGPLNISRCPQGQPVIFQAGASETGRDFAARFADGIFSIPESRPEALAFYQDIKRRAVSFGRDPDDLRIMPSSPIYVGSTEAEARAKVQERAELVDAKAALSGLAKYFNQHDMTRYDPDEPFPLDLIDQHQEGYQTIVERVRSMAKRGLTLKQVAQNIASSRASLFGTPEQIADEMTQWFEGRCSDGFMISNGLPGELDIFVSHVVPILQERGLFHREYEGTTLRDSLGLVRPRSRFEAQPGKEAT